MALFEYIGDQLHAHQDAPILKMRRETILNLLDRLGFCISHAKSMLGEPLKRVRYLGMLVDMALGVFAVPEVKHACLPTSEICP